MIQEGLDGGGVQMSVVSQNFGHLSVVSKPHPDSHSGVKTSPHLLRAFVLFVDCYVLVTQGFLGCCLRYILNYKAMDRSETCLRVIKLIVVHKISSTFSVQLH